MTYLVTYAVYNEPHTVECTLKQGRFWNNDAVAIDYKIIMHVVEKKEPVNKPSVLDAILSCFVTTKEKEDELKVYDDLKFVDVNEQIKNKL